MSNTRFIEDFLLPALESNKYGEKLRWIDRDEKIFSMTWNHKSGAMWSEDDTEVFQDWDRMKGRCQPEKETYLMESKQRFRAALYRLGVKKVPTESKQVRCYQLQNIHTSPKCGRIKREPYNRKTFLSRVAPNREGYIQRNDITMERNLMNTPEFCSSNPKLHIKEKEPKIMINEFNYTRQEPTTSSNNHQLNALNMSGNSYLIIPQQQHPNHEATLLQTPKHSQVVSVTCESQQTAVSCGCPNNIATSESTKLPSTAAQRVFSIPVAHWNALEMPQFRAFPSSMYSLKPCMIFEISVDAPE